MEIKAGAITTQEVRGQDLVAQEDRETQWVQEDQEDLAEDPRMSRVEVLAWR